MNTATTAVDKGKQAEQTACRYLQQQGLKLLTSNYRSPHGELDLIMTEEQTLVFIEVRCRSNHRFGSAEETVDKKKQTKLIATALSYLQTHTRLAKREIRFDVIAMTSPSDTTELRWIKHAFEA